MPIRLSGSLATGTDTKAGMKISGSYADTVELYREAANVLITPDSFVVDVDIYQDDVIYPAMSFNNDTVGLTILTIKCQRFDSTDTSNNYEVVHWWISTSNYGAPATLTSPFSALTLAITGGTKLDGTALPLAIKTTNTGLQTAITDNNETITLTVTQASPTESTTNAYLMAEVQGIIYSMQFPYDTGV